MEIGNIEFKISGVERGFRFGTWAMKVIADESGVKDIKKTFRLIQGIDDEGNRTDPDLNTMLIFYYACAVNYAKHMKQRIDFEVYDVSEWVSELGFERINEMTLQLFDMYTSKNLNPPVETGETTAK